MRKLRLSSANQRSPNRIPADDIVKLVEDDVDGGMVTNADPANLENNEFLTITNFVVRFHRTSRRRGTSLYTPIKPNANRVLLLTPFDTSDGTVRIVRFTPSTIHYASAAVWTEVTGAGLNGGNNDRFTTTILDDRMFFSNNGVDQIQEITLAGNTYARLGNADRWRYITGFGGRVVAGYYNEAGLENGVLVGWSALDDYAEWDPAVDPTAGEQPLSDSSSDTADFIAFVKGFSSSIQIVRNRSIWEGIVLESPTNPFRFYNKWPGVGCDCPWTVQPIPFGLMWVDVRTNAVYEYILGQPPRDVSDPNRTEIINIITDKEAIFASYNQNTDEYSIVIPNSISETYDIWTYSRRESVDQQKPVWFHSTRKNLTTLNDLDYVSGTLAIQDLVGDINGLVGNIEDLVVTTLLVTRFQGFSDGRITYTNNEVDADDGVDFTSVLESKTYQIPGSNTIIANLVLRLIPRLAGSITVQYSKDDGETYTNYKIVTYGADDLNINQIIKCQKPILSDRFRWQLTCTDGAFDMSKYEIWVSDGGEQRQ